VEPADTADTATSPTAEVAAPVNGEPEVAAQPVPAAPAADPSTGERHIALFTYESTEPGDLMFQQGDVIMVTEKHGEWWTGQLGGISGIFPSNYVQKIEETEAEPASEPTPSPQIVAQSSQSDPVVSSNKAPVYGLGRAPSVKKRKGEVAVTIAPYESTSSEQLTLQRGQLVMVRKKSETGWWEGEIQTRGKQRQIGWFPASFVKLKTSRRMSIPDESEPPMPDAQCPGDAPTPDPNAPKELVVAQFAYEAQNDDELTFQADDVISVVNKDDQAWWKGELRGAVGLFPSNYVAPQTAQ